MQCRMSRSRGVHEASTAYPSPEEGQGQELAEWPLRGPLLFWAIVVL